MLKDEGSVSDFITGNAKVLFSYRVIVNHFIFTLLLPLCYPPPPVPSLLSLRIVPVNIKIYGKLLSKVKAAGIVLDGHANLQ